MKLMGLVNKIAKGADEAQTTLKLPNDLEVMLTLTRKGQSRPDINDNVVVEGIFRLPCSSDDLHLELQFGSRLSLFNDYMYSKWAYANRMGEVTYRAMTFTHNAETWRKAALKVVKEFNKGFNDLAAMVKARQDALLNAEMENPNEISEL